MATCMILRCFQLHHCTPCMAYWD